MGQQQLLLIVLGVIIVGIAVVVGINLFNANAKESAKDTIVSEGTNLGAMAQQYFKKPTALGGGGNTFAGFVIPVSLATTPSATWAPSGTADDKGISFLGTPLSNSGYLFTVTVAVTPTGITSTVTNL
jgi:hypothetical protein